MTDEHQRLNDVAGWYSANGFEGAMVRDSARAVASACRGPRVLEVGAAEGFVTRELARRVERVVVVEPATRYADMVRALALPNVEVVEQLAEDFSTAERFDEVVLSHVLEHVEEPVRLLATARSLLQEAGRVLVAVPNAGSLHRRLGVRAGFLHSITSLTPADLQIGHRRVYSPDRLEADLVSAGLAVVSMSGRFCKPLANSQIDDLPDAVQVALLELGDEVGPAFASELFAVAVPA